LFIRASLEAEWAGVVDERDGWERRLVALVVARVSPIPAARGSLCLTAAAPVSGGAQIVARREEQQFPTVIADDCFWGATPTQIRVRASEIARVSAGRRGGGIWAVGTAGVSLGRGGACR
jgi:hypothetical protein